MKLIFTDDNGRQVKPEEFGSCLEKSITRQLEKDLERLAEDEAMEFADENGLTSIYCPIHKCGPKNFRFEPIDLEVNSAILAFDKCCQKLSDELAKMGFFEEGLFKSEINVD